MNQLHNILLAEDNPDDALLMQRAAKQAGINGIFHIVGDGEEAISYLEGQGQYGDRTKYPIPTIVILDLKMPRKSGMEVLEWLKTHPELQVVPTIILTASMIPADIKKAYHLGANTYFAKPTSFNELVKMMTLVNSYWDQAQRP